MRTVLLLLVCMASVAVGQVNYPSTPSASDLARTAMHQRALWAPLYAESPNPPSVLGVQDRTLATAPLSDPPDTFFLKVKTCWLAPEGPEMHALMRDIMKAHADGNMAFFRQLAAQYEVIADKRLAEYERQAIMPDTPDAFFLKVKMHWPAPGGPKMHALLKRVKKAHADGDTALFQQLSKQYATQADQRLAIAKPPAQLADPADPVELFFVKVAAQWKKPHGQWMNSQLLQIKQAHLAGDTERCKQLIEKYTAWADKYLVVGADAED